MLSTPKHSAGNECFLTFVSFAALNRSQAIYYMEGIHGPHGHIALFQDSRYTNLLKVQIQRTSAPDFFDISSVPLDGP